MPNVTATPRGLLNGEIVTEFTDTTSTSSVTYTYPVQQAGISIENSGMADIFVTVGSYTNQLVNPNKTWKADAVFTSFSIRSNANSQEFTATAYQNDIEGSEEADSVAREKISAINAQLAETPHMPRLEISQVVSRGGIKNQAGASSDLIVFKDIYHTYDVAIKATGVVYGLAEHYVGGTTQGVYKSLDGGNTWVKMGDLTINQSTGVWYEKMFVEPFQETLYFTKVNNGYNTPENNDVVSFNNTLTQLGTKNIGAARWLSGNHTIDASPNKAFTQRVVIFGEYNIDVNATALNLWRTTDKGVTWTSVLSQTGNNGVPFGGEIRHFHCVQVDHFTGDWWASAGDGDSQSKIWRSQNDGLTWTLLFSGSQRERTCGFVFEQDYIYYGMDSTSTDTTATKIVRIKRSDLSRVDVGVVDMGYAVYSLTRTYYPDGFLVWSCYENGASVKSNRIAIQFYDYLTEKLYTIAYLTTIGAVDAFTGFQGASRHQDRQSGNVFAMPTTNIQQTKYDSGNVSRYIKAKVTT